MDHHRAGVNLGRRKAQTTLVSPLRRLWALSVGAGSSAVFAGMIITSSKGEAIAFSIAAAAALAFCVRAFRAGAELVDGDELVIRNPFRTYRVGLSDIRGVRMSPPGIVVRSGRVVPVWAGHRMYSMLRAGPEASPRFERFADSVLGAVVEQAAAGGRNAVRRR